MIFFDTTGPTRNKKRDELSAGKLANTKKIISART